MVEALENIRVKYQPIRWCEDGLVMYNEGQAWTSVMIDGEPQHCHLGDEATVKAILCGEQAISDKCSYKRQMALARVLQIKEVIHGRETGGEGVERSGPNGIFRGKQADIRLPKNRQRATRRPAHKARTRVFRR